MGPPPTISLLTYKSIINESLPWIEGSVPHFECDDVDVTQTYWYRWRLFHLHMVRRPKWAKGCSKPQGCWVLTEFLKKVWWGGAYGTISCPASHHIMEGRWLRDNAVVDDYARALKDNGKKQKQCGALLKEWRAEHAAEVRDFAQVFQEGRTYLGMH